MCTMLRCVHTILPLGITFHSKTNLILAYVAMVCNGMGAPWVNFGGPIISAAWFPVAQRATATSIIAISPYLGTPSFPSCSLSLLPVLPQLSLGLNNPLPTPLPTPFPSDLSLSWYCSFPSYSLSLLLPDSPPN
jgi:hypothetical protein